VSSADNFNIFGPEARRLRRWIEAFGGSAGQNRQIGRKSAQRATARDEKAAEATICGPCDPPQGESTPIRLLAGADLPGGGTNLSAGNMNLSAGGGDSPGGWCRLTRPGASRRVA
jgi:hypothetical protein